MPSDTFLTILFNTKVPFFRHYRFRTVTIRKSKSGERWIFSLDNPERAPYFPFSAAVCLTFSEESSRQPRGRVTPDSTREMVLSGHIMSPPAWQECGVKENDNTQHPDDDFYPQKKPSPALQNRLAMSSVCSVCVCVALCGVTDVGSSHK